MEQKNQKLISLKEASKISGYAPDYVGQLIRSGKLSGRQVYANVQWMTTESALREYIDKNREGEAGYGSPSRGIFRRTRPERVFQLLLYGVLGLSLLFSLLLFYIFSVQVDKRLEKKVIETLETSERQ